MVFLVAEILAAQFLNMNGCMEALILMPRFET